MLLPSPCAAYDQPLTGPGSRRPGARRRVPCSERVTERHSRCTTDNRVRIIPPVGRWPTASPVPHRTAGSRSTRPSAPPRGTRRTGSRSGSTPTPTSRPGHSRWRGRRGQVGEERPGHAPAPVLGPYVEVLQVDPDPSGPGREVAEMDRHPDHLATVVGHRGEHHRVVGEQHLASMAASISTASGARSYSARSWTICTRAGTSDGVARRRITGPGGPGRRPGGSR